MPDQQIIIIKSILNGLWHARNVKDNAKNASEKDKCCLVILVPVPTLPLLRLLPLVFAVVIVWPECCHYHQAEIEYYCQV